MSGLRAAQKAERRARMLATAGRLFEQRGYSSTTFDAIAAASGFAVATVYKYFKSKDGIVVALLRPDLERVLARGESIIADPPDDPAEAMVALLRCYGDLGGRNWQNREVLRLTVFPGPDNEGPIADFIRAAEAGVQDQILRLLEQLRRRARLARALSLDGATTVLFALLNQEFGSFLSDNERRFSATFRRLARSVRLVFDDWHAPRGRPRGRFAPARR